MTFPPFTNPHANLMPPWTILLLLFLANVALGWQILRLFAAPDLDRLEQLFLSFALGTAVTGTVALILAEVGFFALTTLFILWLLALFALMLVGRKKQAAPVTPLPLTAFNQLQFLLLLIWLPAAIWLFFRPHEFVMGGADAGVYTNLSASIVRQGSIVFDDPLLAGLDEELAPHLLRPVPNQSGADYYLVPAFFVTDVGNGRITPQFYALHPVWQAVAYSLGGPLPGQAIRASLLLTGLWALAGVLAVYLATRQAAGWPAAILALAGLSINGVQVWFARYPTTEMLSQFWLWTGLWAIGAWLSGRPSARLWALVGGVALGQFFLVRIDALFMLPVLGVLALWLWLRRQDGRFWFLLPLLSFVAHATAHGWWVSRPYFLELSGYGWAILRQQQELVFAAAILSLLLLVFSGYALRRHGQRYLARLAQWQRPLMGLLAIVLLLLALYAWFVRPTLPTPAGWVDSFSNRSLPNTNLENFVRLGWYLSPMGIALGALGVAWLVWRMEAKTAVLLAITLLYTLFYLWNIRANPHQIYAARRYIMAAIPLFAMGATVLLTQIAAYAKIKSTVRYTAVLLLALAWLGSTAWAARGYISQVDYRGIINQLDAVHEQLQPQSILLFADPAPIGVGDYWGTPLKFLYGHHVFTLRSPNEANPALLVQTIKNWQNMGYTVYWVGDPAWLEQQNRPYKPVLSTTLITANLEGTYDRKPQNIVNVNWPLPIIEIEQ